MHDKDLSIVFRSTPRLLCDIRAMIRSYLVNQGVQDDKVQELVLAVDEACTRLIRSATPGATLVVIVDPRDDVVVVEASTTCDTDEVVAEGSFSWHVLSSLTDDLKTFHNGASGGAGAGPDGRVFGITLTTRRAGTAR